MYPATAFRSCRNCFRHIFPVSVPLFKQTSPLLLVRFSTATAEATTSTSSTARQVRHAKKDSIRPISLKRLSVKRSGNDTFLAEEGVTWKSLGLSEEVQNALVAAGLNRPSIVQAACIPVILAGKDVIVAAETGSGKTHGYLVPIMDKLYGEVETEGDCIDKTKSHAGKLALVLCPNATLCDQVAHMASSMPGRHGNSLLRVMPLKGGEVDVMSLFVTGLCYWNSLCCFENAFCMPVLLGGFKCWPVTLPDILVSTPAALLNGLLAYGRRNRRYEAFIQHVKYVVFDEADLLICGSFQHQVFQLINMFRLEEKKLSQEMEKEISSCNEKNSLSWKNFKAEESGQENKAVEAELVNSNLSSNVELDEMEDRMESKDVKKERLYSRRLYKRRKQYIFVAATLPESGKKTAGGLLKRFFPDATWISGSFLHQHNPRLEQRWIQVTVDTQIDALINAIKDGQSLKQSPGTSMEHRTMIFANTVNAAESITKILHKSGIECMRYHKETPTEERNQNLKQFQEEGGVLVCTDAAARGLDIPHVSHVIQAEFAASAVDFLHRIGRTGRAGQPGFVTSLYTKSNRELVEAVREAGSLGQSVEKAFSRKRSFRKKLRKANKLAVS